MAGAFEFGRQQQQHGALVRSILGRLTNQESRAVSSGKGSNLGGGMMQ
jgi:hypothetical protein